MNPYSVLMLTPGAFTLDDLKNNYRRLASQLHPGRCRLSKKDADDVLAMLTKCYRTLMDDYTARVQTSSTTKNMGTLPELVMPSTSRASTADVASSSSSSSSSTDVCRPPKQQRPSRSKSPVASTSDDRAREMAKKFNMARFNEVFDKNRTPSVYDKGYLEWLNGKEAEEKDGDSAPKACDEQVIHDPEPVTFLKCRNMTYTEIGVDDVNDFSKINDYGPRNSIKYSDLRQAHSARNNMIDARLVKEFKEQNKTLEDLKAERASKESITLTPAQEVALAERRIKAAQREKQRERSIETQDQFSAKQFNRAHASMFSGR